MHYLIFHYFYVEQILRMLQVLIFLIYVVLLQNNKQFINYHDYSI
jgi:hypothetical protein